MLAAFWRVYSPPLPDFCAPGIAIAPLDFSEASEVALLAAKRAVPSPPSLSLRFTNRLERSCCIDEGCCRRWTLVGYDPAAEGDETTDVGALIDPAKGAGPCGRRRGDRVKEAPELGGELKVGLTDESPLMGGEPGIGSPRAALLDRR